MKKVILLVLLTIGLATSHSFAQYGNEWINFSQTYHKIKVAQTGVYRISQAQLLASGIGSAANPQNLQLFHKGRQVHIYVEGQTDGTIDPGDYIDFYGVRKDRKSVV